MRKMLWSHLVLSALGCTLLSFAQQMPNRPFQTHQLAPTVYWVGGGGGSNGIIVGDNGVIIVDAKTTPEDGKRLLGEAARITRKPVTAVILTHRDLDHIGGLAPFSKGIQIIAHKVDVGFEAPIPPFMKQKPTIIPPTRVLDESKVDLKLEGVSLELLHWAPAHTSADTIVYLPAQKIVFAGDILDSGFAAGHIHFEQHGTSAGWIETVKGMIALDSDVYIPGHGPVENKQAVEAHLQTAETERARVEQMVAEGESLAVPGTYCAGT